MIKRIGIALLLLLFFVPSASTAERGTAEEAQALVEKAIARHKEVGTEQIIASLPPAARLRIAISMSLLLAPPPITSSSRTQVIRTVLARPWLESRTATARHSAMK
jgi:hypothetical protein